MMAKYDSITKYAGELAENPGTWTEAVEHDGCLTLPMFEPSERMQAFLEDFHSGDWLDGEDYNEVITAAGIDLTQQRVADLDLDEMNGRTVLALLTRAIRADRFFEGALEQAAKSGFLDDCLYRLEEIDSDEDLAANLPEDIKRLADEILYAMDELPEGTKLTAARSIGLTRESQGMTRQNGEIYYLNEGLTLSQFESWNLAFALRRRAESHGLFLDSSEWDDAVIGTPENIPFLVRHLTDQQGRKS